MIAVEFTIKATGSTDPAEAWRWSTLNGSGFAPTWLLAGIGALQHLQAEQHRVATHHETEMKDACIAVMALQAEIAETRRQLDAAA